MPIVIDDRFGILNEASFVESISMCRNCIKYKYMFLFALKNLAHKGLISNMDIYVYGLRNCCVMDEGIHCNSLYIFHRLNKIWIFHIYNIHIYIYDVEGTQRSWNYNAACPVNKHKIGIFLTDREKTYILDIWHQCFNKIRQVITCMIISSLYRLVDTNQNYWFHQLAQNWIRNTM